MTKEVVVSYRNLSEQVTMPSGSPASDKYVVYTVDTDDSSSGLEDGQIVFRDPDGISLREKSRTRSNQRLPLRSPSSDSWGPYWSKREKCCCLWNLFLIVVVVSLASVFIVFHKNFISSGQGTENSSDANSLSTISPLSSTKEIIAPQTEDKICTSHECVQLAGSILSKMDPSTDPCEDFYQYSCGGFQNQVFLSWQKPRIRENPDLVLANYEEFLKDKLSSPEDSTSSLTENQLKIAYQSCLKRENISAKNLKEKFRDLVLSLNASDADDNGLGFTKLVAMVTRDFGASPFFKVVVEQTGQISILNRYSDDVIKDLYKIGVVVGNFRHMMPSELYYRDPLADKVMIGYKSFLRNALATILQTDDPDNTVFQELSNSLNDVFNLEISLMQKLYTEETMDTLDSLKLCSKKINTSLLQSQYPGYNISWNVFINILLNRDNRSNDVTDLCHIDISPSVEIIIKNTNYRLLKNYIIIHTLLFTDVFLLYSDQMTFPFSSQTNIYTHLNNVEEDSFCMSFLNMLLPLSSLIRIPKRDIFKSESVMLFQTLKTKLTELVNGLYWIPAEQRRGLADHVSSVILTFEWDQWNNGSLQQVYQILHKRSYDYVAVFLAFINFKSRSEMMGKLIKSMTYGKACSFDDRHLSLELTAAAIRKPVFHYPTTVPVMFGSTGAIISQSLVTAFDMDALLQHFMIGNIDRSVLYTMAHHSTCLIDTYNQYQLNDTRGNSYQVRGDLTKGENFKDSLSLHISHRAYKASFERGYEILKLPGLNITDDRLFYITYTQTLCEKINRRGIETYYIGKQSLPSFLRVQGTFSNFPDFSDAFHCSKHSKMNLPLKCVIF